MYKQTLNRESNHYRRCPNCDIELMANHGNRKFCSDKCGDDYNNRGKQIIKSMIPPEVPKIETMITPTDHNTFYVKKCIEILWQCKIPFEGKRVSLQTLREKGWERFDFPWNGLGCHWACWQYNLFF